MFRSFGREHLKGADTDKEFPVEEISSTDASSGEENVSQENTSMIDSPVKEVEMVVGSQRLRNKRIEKPESGRCCHIRDFKNQ